MPVSPTHEQGARQVFGALKQRSSNRVAGAARGGLPHRLVPDSKVTQDVHRVSFEMFPSFCSPQDFRRGSKRRFGGKE